MDFLNSLVHFFPSFVSGIGIALAGVWLLNWLKERFFPLANEPFILNPVDGEKAHLGDTIKFTRQNITYEGKLVAFTRARGGDTSLGIKQRRDRTMFQIRANADEWEIVK